MNKVIIAQEEKKTCLSHLPIKENTGCKMHMVYSQCAQKWQISGLAKLYCAQGLRKDLTKMKHSCFK